MDKLNKKKNEYSANKNVKTLADTKDFIEISNILQKGLSSDDTYSAIFQLLERTIPFDSATLFLKNAKSGQLEAVINRGDFVVDLASDVFFLNGKGINFLSIKLPVLIMVLLSGRYLTHEGNTKFFI